MMNKGVPRPLWALAFVALLSWRMPAHAATQTIVCEDSNHQPQVVSPDNPCPVTTTPSGIAVPDTPTIQAAQYVSGNCIGGFRSVTVAAAGGGAMDPTAFTVRSVSGQTPTITVYLFSANPSASTCTDKSTFTLASADVAKIIGQPFSVTLVTSTGATATSGRQTFSPPLIAAAAAGSQLMYYALVSGSTWTPGSTTDIQTATEALH